MHKVGDTINSRWTLIEELCGKSGQADTFLVIDSLKPDDSTQYVIKLLKIEDPKALTRFEKEIRACFALKHRNIVKVKDSAFEDTTTPYLVTEYCSGRELTAEKIRDLPTTERLRMFEYICEAIAHAHQEAIIHRDIKPANIFLENSDSLIPIVGDFGLCFFKGDQNAERQTPIIGESIGNWEFGPPEGHMGRQNSPDESFDVYNLGKLLYWLLSGGRPVYREYSNRPEYDLRKDSADHVVHRAYEVIGKSVNEDSARRYSTAATMLDDVKELVVFAENDGRYLDCALPQSCVFCRVGNYDFQFLGTHPDDRYQFAEHGLNFQQPQVPVSPRILFGRCGHCGNVQQFRLDGRVKPDPEWKNLKPVRAR